MSSNILERADQEILEMQKSVKNQETPSSSEQKIKLTIDQCITQYASTILNASKIQKLRSSVKSFDLYNDTHFFRRATHYDNCIKKINSICANAFPDLNIIENDVNIYNIGALSIHFFKLSDEIESFNRELSVNEKKDLQGYMKKKIQFYLNIISLGQK